MAVNYSLDCINARLQGVINTVDSGGSAGNLKLLAGVSTVSTVALSFPCGTVSGGVLTFTGTLLDTSVAGTGNVTSAQIEDSLGNVVISGLTVGVPPSTAFDVLISNGLNSTLITAGQVVSVLSAQIRGS